MRAPVLGFGLGAVCGGFEAVGLGATLDLSLSFPEAAKLAVVTVLLDAVLGLLLAVPAGTVAWLLSRRQAPARAHALSMALTAVLLGSWFLWPAAWTMHGFDRQAAAVAFVLVPLAIGGVVWFNALYWLRREEIGEDYKVGWKGWSLVIGLALGLTSAGWLSQRAFGGGQAIETDPAVLFVTIDTLRADHIGAYGSTEVATPVLDGLAERGLRFANASAPMPETAPSHAAMFTGRHPVRNGVVSNGHVLANGYKTLSEVLQSEGYATGAFVSSFALDGETGLDQGFEVYDDAFFPWVRGLSEVQSVRLVLKVVMRYGDPLKLPWLLERPAPATYDLALDWVERNRDKPFFLWVHTFEPHSPYEPHGLPGYEDNGVPGAPSVDHRWILAHEEGFAYDDDVRAKLRRLYAEEVAYADAELGRFLDDVNALDLRRDLLVVLVGDHGEMLGEHGIEFNHHGIWEEAVHVPLIVVPVRYRGRDDTRVVEQQVRVMDLYATVLQQLQLDVPEDTESADIVHLAELPNQRGYATLLMGRKTASLSQGTLYGYRLTNRETGSTAKYIVDPDDGAEYLFDLGPDPHEQDDLACRQRSAVMALRKHVEGETGEHFDLPDRCSGAESAPAAAADEAAPPKAQDQKLRKQVEARKRVDLETQNQLEALGYVE